MGRNTWSFFLEAKRADDTLDTTGGDSMTSLTQLLADDCRRGVWIQEPVTDHLLDDLVGAAVIGFGAAFVALEGQGALRFEGLAQLKVALPGEAEFGSGGQRPQAFAFAFIEHGEFGENGIARRSGELASGAGENQGVFGCL